MEHSPLRRLMPLHAGAAAVGGGHGGGGGGVAAVAAVVTAAVGSPEDMVGGFAGGHGGGFGGGGFRGGGSGGFRGGAISGFRGGVGGFRAAALSGGFRGARFDGLHGRGIRVAGFHRHRGFPIAAGLGFGGWGYYDSCIVWTGYNWVNVCY